MLNKAAHRILLRVEISVKRLARNVRILAKRSDGDVVDMLAFHKFKHLIFNFALPFCRLFRCADLVNIRRPLFRCFVFPLFYLIILVLFHIVKCVGVFYSKKQRFLCNVSKNVRKNLFSGVTEVTFWDFNFPFSFVIMLEVNKKTHFRRKL